MKDVENDSAFIHAIFPLRVSADGDGTSVFTHWCVGLE